MSKFNIQTKNITTGKVLVKNSTINFLGMALPLIVGIIAIPFAIKGLGKEEFGILSIAWVILGYFGLFDFGLSRATTKFVSEMLGKNDILSIPPIIWTSIFVSIILGFIGSIVLFIITSSLVNNILNIPNSLIHQSEITFYILSLSIPFILCSTILRGALEASQRFDLVNLVVIPTSILSFIIPSLSYLFNFNLPIIILLIIITRLCALVIYFFFCLKIFPGLRGHVSFRKVELKKMFLYGGWVSVTNIISPLLVYMDRFFIGTLISMASVAYYTAPYEVLVRLRIVPSALIGVIFPEFSASSTINDDLRLRNLFIRSTKYILIIIGGMVIILVTYAPLILNTWLGREFSENSSTVFRILAIGVLLNSLSYVPFSLLQGIGRPDLPAKFHIIEFPIYLFSLYFLIKSFGIVGASCAWSLRIIIDALFLFSAVIKIYPMMIEKLVKCISYIAFWLLLYGLFIYYSSVLFSNNWGKIISLMIIMITFSVIVLKFILIKEERDLIISALKVRLK